MNTKYTKYTKQEIAHTMVCADFIKSFIISCESAGGACSWESFKTKTLEECMHLLAPNGIRMAYYKTSNIEAVEISDALVLTIDMLSQQPLG